MSGPVEPPDRSWLVPAAVAVIRRPALWGTAWRQLRALAAPGWLSRPPHLPLPPDGYLRFRLVTAYGDRGATPVPSDLISYLSWCRDERRRSHAEARSRRPDGPFRAMVGR